MKYISLLLLLLAVSLLMAQESADVAIEIDTSFTESAEAELPPIEKMPEVRKFIQAEYPAEAMKAGIQGVVKLEIVISDSGRVDSVKIIEGISPDLDSAALRAVSAFEFTPAVAGGVPVPVAIEYNYRFSLQEAVKEIEAYVNFKGRLREKGTRTPIADGMVVVTILDSTADSTMKVPYSTYLNTIGSFEGQYLEEGRLVTVTDSLGYFRFKSLPACSIQVAFPISGYKLTQSIEVIEQGKEIEMEYRLSRESYDEYEIVVYGKVEKKEVAKKTLSVSEIKRIPGFGGDAVKVVRALPGVARPSFVSGDIIIRGSGAEDTRFFLDGVELPRVFHFGGLRSVYNSELLSSLDMYPGGFNTRYGGAVGGIVELKGRPAKTDRWHGEVDVNLLDAGLRMEGPLNEKLSLQVAGRYSYIGEFVEAITKDAPVTVIPFYWDGLMRLDWNLNKNNKLFLTYNTSRDKLEIITGLARGGSEENAEDTDKGLSDDFYQMAILGHDLTISKALKNELRFSLEHETGDGSMFGYSNWKWLGYTAHVRDEVAFAPSKSLTLKAGVDGNVKRIDYKMSIMGATGYMGNDEVQYFSILGAYSNLEYYIIKNLMIMPGIRYDYYADIEEGQPSFRLTSRYEYLPGWTLKGAAGTYSQFPKPMGQSTDDAWGNPDLPSTKAVQYVGGHEWQLTDMVSLDAQVYYNTQTDVPNYTDSTNLRTGKKLNFLPDMEARMYGLEIMLRHDQGKRFFGWMTYSLSRSERRAPNPFSEGTANASDWDPEKWVLGEYDQTHNIQLLGSWRMPRNWESGFRLRYVTGNPMTPLLSYTRNEFEFNTEAMGHGYQVNMGEAFSDRMGPFVQLDIRVDKKFVFKSWILTSYLDFQNVNYFFYNSPEFYDYNYDKSEREAVGAIFLPSFGITAQF